MKKNMGSLAQATRAGNAEQEDVTEMSMLKARQPCGRSNTLQQAG